MFNRDTVRSEQLGHLGLVAATIRELGIIERIDARELNKEKGGIVSYGRRVAAMLLNGLGFMNSRLYMTSHFFDDNPVAQLLGAEVEAAHLNDDCLGRCFDKIAEYGVTKLYSELAFEIVRENNLLSQRVHLDSTSLVLYGRYEKEANSPDIAQPAYGYSKANRPDLKQVVQSLLTSLRYHQIHYDILPIERYSGKGRPKPGAPKMAIGYQIHASLSTCLHSVRAKKETLGRFILATNQMDNTLLTAHSLRKQYKEQACVESSFKRMKNNTFELDAVFRKTPERISALMMVMTLCLMVYNFSQSHLRKCLEEHDKMLPNQLGKPVKNPTMRWIAELMNSIAVVTLVSNHQKHRIVTNLKPVHHRIISYFGKYALTIYGLPQDIAHVPITYNNYKNFLNWCEM